jgi:DNA-binding CsgD family transcriptional regulator/tetratricopeptide (TPR) repeat protein
MPTRASTMVGREAQLQAVARTLRAAAAGRGAAIFLVGEAGIGKSRLAAAAADLAFAAEMVLLRGRGSAIGPSVPFRPLTEALLSLLRSGEPVDVAGLGPYRPALARLIPDWGPPAPGAGDASLVILAEAVLRLTGLAGRDRGCLMVLDDLQDADAETLAVVEYLIDNLERQPTLLLCTVRAEPGAAFDLARSAARRDACTLLELDRLGRDELRLLAASCLSIDPERLPEAVVERLYADSAGIPFVAEELLDGMISGGLLARDADGWRLVGQPQTSVPATLARSVAARVDLLGGQGRDLLLTAAVLGRRFPLSVVQAVTGLDDRSLLGHLHAGVAAQLVAPDDQQPDWYQFQHPLTAEALLALLAPGARAGIAARAADVIAAAYPGLPGDWCQLAAALRLDAGDTAAAGRLFAECGTRALASGAAGSAVALLDRARELLATDGDTAVRADVLENLLNALAEAGQVERALACAEALDDLGGGGLDARRRAALHTRLAWAAAVAGRPTDGMAQVRAARHLLGPAPPDEFSAPIDVVAAHLTLDLPGRDRLHAAEDLARQAAAVGESVPLPVVACQAWQLLGALVRRRDLDEANDCLERARMLAVKYELPIWEIHALVRLGNQDALRDGGIERLEQARQKAVRVGAVTASCHAEAGIAMQVVLHGDFTAAAAQVDRVYSTTTRLRFIELTQYALLTRAVLAAHRGSRREMDAAVAEFGRWEGNESHHVPLLYGLARTFCALLEEDRDRARAELTRATAVEDENPTIFHLAGRDGLELLLRVLAGELDRPGLDAALAAPASNLRWNRQFALLASAALLGREGRPAEAAATVEEAQRAAAPFAMTRWLGLRLIAEEAVEHGWGSPVDWLRAAEEHFHAAGVTAVAGACRALLRRCGVALNQRRRGAERIPSELRSSGVTVREYEVLALLADRHGNRAIAGRLHISPRTVEKHVASLLAKTGQPDRLAMGEYAAGLLAE